MRGLRLASRRAGQPWPSPSSTPWPAILAGSALVLVGTACSLVGSGPAGEPAATLPADGQAVVPPTQAPPEEPAVSEDAGPIQDEPAPLAPAFLPSDLARITADNADQLRLVAELGAINVLRAWFSPNASKLAAILVNQNFRVSGIGVWDLGSGEQSFALEAKPADITFSPDGQSVALIFWDQVIEVYDSTLGELLWSLESDFDEAAFASDWEQIAVSSWDGGGGTQTSTVRVLDPVSGTERWSAEVKDQIGGLSFSPDGRTLYGQVSHGPGVDGSLACWAVDDGQTCAVPPLKGLPIFSSDGRFAAGPSDWLVSPGIEVYETGAWKRVATMDAGGKPVHHLALSADGEIVGAEVGYRLRLWDAGSGRELVELPDQFIDFQFSPDGRLVAAWDSLGSLKLLGVSP